MSSNDSANSQSQALPSSVKLVEVGARDGLQNEKSPISVDTKLELLEGLAQAGLRSLEAGSFVSPKWVPQMAGSDEVFQRLKRHEGVSYTALTPNLKGLERAMECNVEEVAVFLVVSETFSQKNTNCTIKEGLERASQLIKVALENNIAVRGYVSCIAGCPYEGPMEAKAVADLSNELYQLGCYEISLGDTIGKGTPGVIREVVEQVSRYVPREKIAMHLHDTYGQAIANIYASLLEGIEVFDSSVAGLGGCPYAKGASGNVATEDVVYLMQGLGIETGIDLDKLVATGNTINKALNRTSGSRVAQAISNQCD